jgi:hypothetical protein
MLADVVTLFPAEIAVGDSVFGPASHRWHEVTEVGSGDGQVLLTTQDGLDLVVPAHERCQARVSPDHADVAAEHRRPTTYADQFGESFFD